jgi:outer membrane receptor for ferrienterochelin and colicin
MRPYNIVLITAILLSFDCIYAQKADLSGTLIDSTTQKPLEFASIVIYKKSRPGTPVSAPKSVFSGSNGKFRFSKLDTGVYKIEAGLLGYRKHTIDSFKLTGTRDFGVIPLAQVTKSLGEVTISAQKPVLEVKADRIVFNLENDPAASAGTAIEALQKLPFITVDQDDNIQLKGKSDFKVQLNGRNTGLFAKNPQDALRTFPASLIKRIEIITTPGARYDAEGVGGIINIVTAGRITGYNGNIFASINSLSQANEGVSFNVKSGKIGVSTYVGSSSGYTPRSSEFTRTNFFPSSLYQENRTSAGRGGNYNVYGNIEVAYDFDTLNTLSVYMNRNTGQYTGYDQSNHVGLNQTLQTIEKGVFYSDNENHWPSASYGIDYIRKYNRPEQELTIILADNENRSGSANAIYRSFDFGNSDFGNHFDSRQPESETTLSCNFVYPVRKDENLSVGTKTIYRRTQNIYAQDTLNFTTGQYARNQPQTGVFEYHQTVWSGYGEYQMKGKGFSIKPGLRFEYTHTGGQFNEMPAFRFDYPALIPTLSASVNLSKTESIRLGYTRRIQRPSLYYLKPQTNSTDPRNVTSGNPYLHPEFTHNIELGFNVFKSQKNLSITLEQSLTTDAINPVTRVDTVAGIARTTYLNIGKNARTACTLYSSGNFGKSLNYGGLSNPGRILRVGRIPQ